MEQGPQSQYSHCLLPEQSGVQILSEEDRGSLQHHIHRKLMVNAYQDCEIWENTRSCSGGLEYTECIQHFGWEMF
jgi:hypothetical protein